MSESTAHRCNIVPTDCGGFGVVCRSCGPLDRTGSTVRREIAEQFASEHEESHSKPPTRYSTIVADPPWPYKTPGGGLLQSSPTHRPNSWQNELAGVGSEKRYGALTIEDICALAPPAADNSHLYLWTTNAFMVEAHEVARAWGFRPITVCTWVKMKPNGTPSMKTGYYFRGATEHFLFCVRGSLRLQTAKAYPTAFLWPRAGAHSEKPGTFYDLVEECSPGPRLELFARSKRLGWDVWGNEVDSDVELVA